MSLNVLVVDDSPLARKIVRKTLALSGLALGEVAEAGDGEQGLAQLSRQGFDVVFTDVNMPGMDGNAMLSRMAADPVLARIPVIVVSTDRSEARLELLVRLGAKAYLTKPLTPEAVRDTVRTVLGLEPAT